MEKPRSVIVVGKGPAMATRLVVLTRQHHADKRQVPEQAVLRAQHVLPKLGSE